MMKNNKFIHKLVSLLLMMTLIFTVVACTNDDDKTSDDKANAEQTSDVPIVLGQTTDKEVEVIATEFVADILNKEFAKAYNDYDFTSEMKDAISEAALGEILIVTKSGYGDFVKDEPNYIVETDEYKAVYVQIEFDKSKMAFQVSFDVDNKIAGFFFQDFKEVDESMSSEEVVEEEVKLVGGLYEEVTFGLEEFMLPATVSTTETSDLIVVMVHGSGPNDRDVTVGPNKIFKDLEIGLLKKDFGSFRYDKRTMVHGAAIAEISDFGLYEETVEDAVLAVAKIREDKGEDVKVVVLGHSQGGHAIPFIARELNEADLSVDGYIIMAGNYSPIHELIEMQLEFLANLDNEYDATEKSEVDKIVQGFDDLIEGKLEPEDPLFYVTASYWQTFLDYDIEEDLKYIDKPTLVLNGSRDYQVPPSEVALWEEVLDDDLTSYHIIDGINHLMIEGFGDPTPNEYYEIGHVDVEVIKIITDFLSGL